MHGMETRRSDWDPYYQNLAQIAAILRPLQRVVSDWPCKVCMAYHSIGQGNYDGPPI